MHAKTDSMKRYYDGIELAPNLYTCQRGRKNRWRFKKKLDSGLHKMVTIPQALSVHDANLLAVELEKAEMPESPSVATLNYVNSYISYQENLNPVLKEKQAWKNRTYDFGRFANDFADVRIIDLNSLRLWWDDLSHYQQKSQQAAMRYFFNWLMGRGHVPRLRFNPFTTADDLPRLLVKQAPKKERPPCTQDLYFKIYNEAGRQGYECLQIAMSISRYTTLRRGDICSLRFDEDITDGRLQIVVNKSLAQKGAVRATRLEWVLSDHPILKAQIDRARELSLINYRCPFIISHTPEIRKNSAKSHLCEVTGDRLRKMFTECRGDSSTTFHEIRGLAATLFKVNGYTDEQIQGLMAHEDKATTQGYQDVNALPFDTVTMRIEG